jgi:hypothetical protein
MLISLNNPKEPKMCSLVAKTGELKTFKALQMSIFHATVTILHNNSPFHCAVHHIWDETGPFGDSALLNHSDVRIIYCL